MGKVFFPRFLRVGTDLRGFLSCSDVTVRTYVFRRFTRWLRRSFFSRSMHVYSLGSCRSTKRLKCSRSRRVQALEIRCPRRRRRRPWTERLREKRQTECRWSSEPHFHPLYTVSWFWWFLVYLFRQLPSPRTRMRKIFSVDHVSRQMLALFPYGARSASFYQRPNGGAPGCLSLESAR